MNLTNLIEKLATYENSGSPFISIYLNAEVNGQGREVYQSWLKKEFSEKALQFAEESEEAQNFAAAKQRIEDFLEKVSDEAANGIAIFSTLNGDFFETVQLDEPFQTTVFSPLIDLIFFR